MKLIFIYFFLLIIGINISAQDFIVKNCRNQSFLIDSTSTVKYGPVKSIKKYESDKFYIIKDSTERVQLFDFDLNLLNNQYWKSIEFRYCKHRQFLLVHGKDRVSERIIYQLMNFDGTVDSTLKILNIQEAPSYGKLELQLLNNKYYSYDGSKLTEISGFSIPNKWSGAYGQGSSGSRGLSSTVKLPQKLKDEGYEITRFKEVNKKSLSFGIKYKNEIILENKYSYIEYLKSSSDKPFFIVKVNSQFGLMNNQGEEILPIQFYSITASRDENIIANVKKCFKSQSYLILNSKGIYQHITTP